MITSKGIICKNKKDKQGVRNVAAASNGSKREPRQRRSLLESRRPRPACTGAVLRLLELVSAVVAFLLPLLLLLKLLLGVMELLFPLMLQLSLFLLLPHLLFACCHIAYLDNEAPVAVADSKRRHWAAAEI